MRKLIYILLLLPFISLAQTQTTNSGKYKMFIPTIGSVNDSTVVWSGADKLLKFLPRSSSLQDLESVLHVGNTATSGFILKANPFSDGKIEANVDDDFDNFLLVNNMAGGAEGHFARLHANSLEFDRQSDGIGFLSPNLTGSFNWVLPENAGTLALAAQIGSGDVQFANEQGIIQFPDITAGFVHNPMLSDLDAGGFSINNIDVLQVNADITTNTVEASNYVQSPLINGIGITPGTGTPDLTVNGMAVVSGTNTGDNATNTTSNTYADSKVIDSIADSDTTHAPSRNAVFDALALKQNLLVNSAGLAAALSDETGTGVVVFSASPAFSGGPTAPTASANTNSTQIATTAYADAKVQNSLSASTTIAPSATAVNAALALKADDSNTVHKTGNETIGGAKTFSLAPILTGEASPTYAQGKLTYDTDNESLTFYNNDSNVSLQIGQEDWIRVRNVSGSTISNGAAVYINGSSSGVPTIALAQANSATTTVCAGLTTESIANNAIGYVTTIGLVRGLDTSTFTTGAIYLSAAVAGGLTQTAPLAPNYRYRVGFVTNVNASTGTIHVTPSTASLGNGTTGQEIRINGSGAQEYFTPRWGTVEYKSAVIASPADATTYYIPQTNNLTAATTAGRTMSAPVPTTSVSWSANIVCSTTASSAETSTIQLRNVTTGGTAVTLTTAFPTNGATTGTNTLSGTTAFSCSQGDKIECIWTTPTWATNPANVYVNFFITFQN